MWLANHFSLSGMKPSTSLLYFAPAYVPIFWQNLASIILHSTGVCTNRIPL
jgi:hypothetical protein